MQAKRTFLYAMLASAITLALVAGPMLWAMPVSAQTGSVDLSTEDAEALQFMREEEKLARDVYLTLGEQWNLRVFQNISRAEQIHMDEVKTLLDKYGIDDPTAGNAIGEFTNSDLQVLYDQLISSDSTSLSDALRTGVSIEEIDILDLQERIAQIDQADIKLVYENLLRGSTNHLRAFVNNLERRTGETVEPQYLDQETYEELLGSSTGRGNGNWNRGNGRNGAGRFGARQFDQPMRRGGDRWNR